MLHTDIRRNMSPLCCTNPFKVCPCECVYERARREHMFAFCCSHRLQMLHQNAPEFCWVLRHLFRERKHTRSILMCFWNTLDVLWTQGHTAPGDCNHGCLDCMVLQCIIASKGLYLIAKNSSFLRRPWTQVLMTWFGCLMYCWHSCFCKISVVS